MPRMFSTTTSNTPGCKPWCSPANQQHCGGQGCCEHLHKPAAEAEGGK